MLYAVEQTKGANLTNNTNKNCSTFISTGNNKAEKAVTNFSEWKKNTFNTFSLNDLNYESTNSLLYRLLYVEYISRGKKFNEWMRQLQQQIQTDTKLKSQIKTTSTVKVLNSHWALNLFRRKGGIIDFVGTHFQDIFAHHPFAANLFFCLHVTLLSQVQFPCAVYVCTVHVVRGELKKLNANLHLL